MTWPSFFAASISLGVIGSGGGASAMTRVENAAPASNAPAPLSTSRRETFGFFIWSLYPLVLVKSAHRKLSFIPRARIKSFVDSSLPLPLDLTVRFGQPPVQHRTRPGFGRLK